MVARLEIDWDREPLGEVSDAELARKWRCSHCTVWRARKARGIPPQRPATSQLAQDRHESVSSTLADCLLGVLSQYCPKTVQELLDAVRESYGSITERQVYRAIRNLRRVGRIQRVPRDDLRYGGLVLTRRPRHAVR